VNQQQYAVPKGTIEKLVRQGKLERERIGDSETGNVIMKFGDDNYYFHRAKFNLDFYVREIRR